MRVASVPALVLIIAAPLAAQDNAGAVVSASVGGTSMDGATSLTFTGSGGYRFNRYVGLEVEVTAIPTVHGTFPSSGNDLVIQGIPISALIFPAPNISNENGRAVFVTNDVRVELPTPAEHVTPFFVAGAGVATVRRTAEYSYRIGILPPVGVGGGGIQTITQPLTASSTDVALTIGGGVTVKIASRASIDGDARYFRLLGDSDRNVGRFGVGVRYRF